MTKFLASAAFILLVTPALAQFEPLQFAICKKISADAERLKCFDAVGQQPKTPEQEAKDPTPIKGKWVYSESKSPVDDSDQVMAILAGEGDDTLLVFRCLEHQSEAVFVPPPGFFATGRASVLIRIGDGAPATISMSVGANGRSLFALPAQDFMKLMPDSTKLFLRASGFQGRQADASFDLADVSAVRERISSTCRWTTPKVDRGTPGIAAPASVQKTKSALPR